VETKAGVLNFDRGSASYRFSPTDACLYAAALKIRSPILLSSPFTDITRQICEVWRNRETGRERERKREKERQIGAHTEFAPRY